MAPLHFHVCMTVWNHSKNADLVLSGPTASLHFLCLSCICSASSEPAFQLEHDYNILCQRWAKDYHWIDREKGYFHSTICLVSETLRSSTVLTYNLQRERERDCAATQDKCLFSWATVTHLNVITSLAISARLVFGMKHLIITVVVNRGVLVIALIQSTTELEPNKSLHGLCVDMISFYIKKAGWWGKLRQYEECFETTQQNRFCPNRLYINKSLAC